MTVLDIISREQLEALREAGYVVIHRVPTSSMIKAGNSDTMFHYGDIEIEFHRMVAESIRLQNKEIKERGQ